MTEQNELEHGTAVQPTITPAIEVITRWTPGEEPPHPTDPIFVTLIEDVEDWIQTRLPEAITRLEQGKLTAKTFYRVVASAVLRHYTLRGKYYSNSQESVGDISRSESIAGQYSREIELTEKEINTLLGVTEASSRNSRLGFVIDMAYGPGTRPGTFNRNERTKWNTGGYNGINYWD